MTISVHKTKLGAYSAINAATSWTDSKGATNWFSASFQPLYEQIRKQMIVDTVKVKKTN